MCIVTKADRMVTMSWDVSLGISMIDSLVEVSASRLV